MTSLPEIDKVKLEDIDKVIYARTDTEFEELNIFEVSERCTWAKKFNLTLKKIPEGVASCSVERTDTIATLGEKGILCEGDTTKNVTVPMYYGDVLKVNAEPADRYFDPTYTTLPSKVTGDLTITVMAGDRKCTVKYPSANTILGIEHFIISSYYTTAQYFVTPDESKQGGQFDIAEGSSIAIDYEQINTNYNITIKCNGIAYGRGEEIKINQDSTIEIVALPHSYTLTITKDDIGVKSHRVYRRETQSFAAELNEVYNGSTIYYGDKLEAVVTAADGFYTPTTNWTNNITTVTGHTTSKSTHGDPIRYTLTCPALPDNLNKYTIYRVADYQNTYMQREELCSISTDYPNERQIDVYHGDILTLVINSAKPGYKTAVASFNGVEYDDSFTVNASNVELTFSDPEVISYILTIPALYTGVSSLTVNRKQSSLTNAPNPWTTKSATKAEQKVEVYYGDIITAYATPEDGYYNPTVTCPSGIIKGDSSITLAAGAKICIITYPATSIAGLIEYQIMDVTNGENNAPILKKFEDKGQGRFPVPQGTSILLYAYTSAYYNDPHLTANGNEWKGGSLQINDHTEIGMYSNPKQYTFSLSSMLGVNSVEVTRTSTNKYGASTGIINSSMPIYYDDVLELTKVNLQDNYHNPEPSWNNNGTHSFENSITVRGNVTLSVNAKLKQVQVTCNAIPKGVNSNYYFTAISSVTTGSANYYPTSSPITFTVDIGDHIIVNSLSGSTGYNQPSVKANGATISESVYKDGIAINSDTTIEIVTGSAIQYKLTVDALPANGVSSYTVTRLKSPIGQGETNKVIANATKNGSVVARIYHLDELAFAAEKAPGYYEPDASPSGTITFDAIKNPSGITAKVTAGAREKYTLTASKANATLAIKKQDGTVIQNGYNELVYGDILYVSANCDWTMYENLSLKINGVQQDIVTNVQVTVTGPIEIVASAQAKQYTLIYPAAPSGISYTILKSIDQYSNTELISYEESLVGGSKTVTSEDYLTLYYTLADSLHWNKPLLQFNDQAQDWENPLRLTANTEIRIIPEPKQYTFTLSSVLGAKNVKVTRTSTQKYGAQTNQVITASTPIYYNDTLTATADLESNYKDLTFSWRMDNKTTIGANITVTSNVTLSVDATPIAYKIYYNARPVGVSSNYYIRYIPDTGSGTREIEPTSDGYFEAAVGDAFVIVGLSAAAGYNTPKVYINGVQNNNWSSDDGITITGEMIIKVEAGSMIEYRLTKETGNYITSHIVTRTSTAHPTAGKGTLNHNDIIYYGDTLTVSATPQPQYSQARTNWTNNAITVTGSTNSKTYVNDSDFKTFTLTYYVLPEHVSSYLVKRTSSPIRGDTSTWQQVYVSHSSNYGGTRSFYYGDVLELTVLYDDGYTGTAKLTGSPTSNREVSITNVDILTTTIVLPALKTGVSGITLIKRTSPIAGKDEGKTWSATSSEQRITAYYGDGFDISGTGTSPAYNPPNIVPSSFGIESTNTVTFTVTPVVKSYTLTKSTGTGIASHTVSRTRSPYQGASTGSLNNGATIYYGDELTHSATASNGYKDPVVQWSVGGTPVKQSTTSKATATAKNKVQRTAYSGTLKYPGYTLNTSTNKYVFTYTGYISDIVNLSGDKELVSVEGYTGEYGNISYNNYSFTSTISIDNYGVDPDEMLNEFSFTVKVVYNEYS